MKPMISRVLSAFKPVPQKALKGVALWLHCCAPAAVLAGIIAAPMALQDGSDNSQIACCCRGSYPPIANPVCARHHGLYIAEGLRGIALVESVSSSRRCWIVRRACPIDLQNQFNGCDFSRSKKRSA
jgi:hypothetical protein